MTEKEMREHLQERLKDITADGLSQAVREIMAMPHDYGTVCVALGQIAAAAARAADREPNGGITGFQAGAVFWEFVSAWGVFGGEGPKRMVDYSNMLFPQYERDFAPTISRETMQWLRDQANVRLLTETHAHPDVRAHWAAIASGAVPFGYEVAADA